MHEQHIIKLVILFIIIIKCVHSFDIFIKKTNNNNDKEIQKLESFYNKTYQIPLFQTRYITIRIYQNDLYRDGNINNHDVIGFKFQVKSTDIRVVDIEKEVMLPARITNTNNSNNVLLEDLFICKLMIYCS
jgi:hypothetical protein